MYKVRIILDTQEDVIRTILVDDKKSLEDLHFIIAKAFNFDGLEMASFYMTDHEWNQGEEIPLFNMSETGEGTSMSTCIINETLPDVNDKLIYVYDFFKMWTFYVEIIENSNTTVLEEKVILSVGDVPSEAPEKEFKADKIKNEFDDDLDSGFNDFENIDDFDFDNY